MNGVVLEPKRPARAIVVAPRLPAFPKNHTGNPFTSEGDILAECDSDLNGKPCGYKVMGPRAEVKRALDAHRKMFHSDQIGVVLLNQPRQ